MYIKDINNLIFQILSYVLFTSQIFKTNKYMNKIWVYYKNERQILNQKN